MASAVDLEDFYEFIKKPVNEEKAIVQQTLDAATRAAESRIGPILQRSFTSRVGSSGGSLILPRTPVVSITSITSIYPPVMSWAVSDVVVDNARAGIIEALYLPFMKHTYRVPQRYDAVYDAGWAVDVAEVKAEFADIYEAVEIIGDHLWKLRMGRAARPGLLGEPRGNPEEIESRLPTGFAIPSRARELLAPYSDEAVS